LLTHRRYDCRVVTEEPLAEELLPLDDDELEEGELDELVVDGLELVVVVGVEVVVVDGLEVVADTVEVVAVRFELVFASAGSWPEISCTAMNSQAAANSPAADAVTRLRIRRRRRASSCLRALTEGPPGVGDAPSFSGFMVGRAPFPDRMIELAQRPE
jgi:hypothetical protein